MRSALRIAHSVRLAAILALGAFAVHQLRYLIAFGASSSAELARQGHDYLANALPVLGVFVLSALLATLIRGRYGAGMARVSFARRVAIFTVTLLGIYISQESLEGLLASGHPGGIAAVLAAGGWLAIPLALAIGLLASLLAGALEVAELAISRFRAEHALRRAPRVAGHARTAIDARRLIAPLALGVASRPPPPVPA